VILAGDPKLAQGRSEQMINRQAGIISAVILAATAIGSWLSVLVYAGHFPQYPVAAVLLSSFVVLGAAGAAGWLGYAIWTRDVRWPAGILIAWALTKQILPNLLYPTPFPRVVYIAAAVFALITLSRRALPDKTRRSETRGRRV
jgi:hypothetical protein